MTSDTTATLPAPLTPLGHGIYAIDTGFHRPTFDAAYLIVQQGRALFVDTGTNFSVPHLMAALAAVGLRPEDVDYVVPTHVHLDHAGGVGLLMQQLPRAKVLVHERGARHLIDPTALILGATAVYGPEEMERSYGRLVPVPADRVQTSHDGMALNWHGRNLRFLDTPGHARHHHCLWDSESRGWFTGDTFGLSYRVFDTEQGAWVMPTTTPVQFEPEAMRRSIDRLMESNPDAMYLTHYSRITSPAHHAERLKRLLAAMVEIGQRHADLEPSVRHHSYKSALRALLWDDLRAHGVAPDLLTDGTADDWLGLDIELNAQGLAVWIDKQATAGRIGS